MAATVAVVRGGTSFEREVSLRGARRVSDALRTLGYDVSNLEIDHTLADRLRELRPAFVFIVAHGAGAEDGALQELLELLGVPYTGSDVLASTLCMDKVLTKRLLQRAGLPTPCFRSFSRRASMELGAATAFPEMLAELGVPLVVKPAGGGSAFGIKLVSDPDQVRTAVLGALAYDDHIIVEQHIAGRELAVTVLGDAVEPRALPVVEIVAERGFYDYAAHYDFDVARLDAPAQLDEHVRARVEDVAMTAYGLLGCRDFARVDIILDGAGEPQVLELNTIPGLTETGPTPFAADAAGMDFEQLVAAIAQRAAAAPSA